jgi:hypothetical protein
MTESNNRQGADDPLATARDLLLRGIMPVPVLPTEKNPIIPKWQNLTITAANVAEHFNGAELNVGARMGSKSGGLSDVDLDCVEALTLWKHFLPTTSSRFGRESKPESHHLYRCEAVDPKASVPFVDDNKKMLVELRIGGGGKGAQSIAPGSRHPSGEFVRWDSDGEPARVEFEKLKTAVTQLAVAALLARYWPVTGRNDVALGVGGFLARAGWSAEAIHKVVWSICTYRGEPSRAEKHATTAAARVASLAAGADTRGLPWLKEKFGAGVAKQLANFVAYRSEPVGEDNRPAITLISGKLNITADKAEEALIAANVQFFERSNALVRPIVKTVDAFHRGKTSTAQFVKVDLTYMRDVLARIAGWYQLDKRSNHWFPVDPPKDIADTILKRAGEWRFPSVAGIATAPSLRADGTILDRIGYDPATRLLLIDTLDMPPIPERPTRDDAIAALRLIEGLLTEFSFVDEVAKSVALSAIVTPVVRGAFLVAPMHVADAPVAGSGKSYLFDTVSTIATGYRMPVITAGRNEEETEKRIGAAVMAGQSQICLDNVSGELRGDALSQLVERPRPYVRVLGKSELFEVEAGGTTWFANGINITIAGDLTRRVIRCRLDPKLERPELRVFTGDPVTTVMKNRSAYVAAALTICRAYFAAGQPDKQTRLASFEGWSDTVRSALTWLGLEDPVKSMESVREDDPERANLAALFEIWSRTFGTGRNHRVLLRDVVTAATNMDPAGTRTLVNPELRSAIDAVMPAQRQPDATLLSYWLRGRKHRVVNAMWFDNEGTSHGNYWWIECQDGQQLEPAL